MTQLTLAGHFSLITLPALDFSIALVKALKISFISKYKPCFSIRSRFRISQHLEVEISSSKEEKTSSKAYRTWYHQESTDTCLRAAIVMSEGGLLKLCRLPRILFHSIVFGGLLNISTGNNVSQTKRSTVTFLLTQKNFKNDEGLSKSHNNHKCTRVATYTDPTSCIVYTRTYCTRVHYSSKPILVPSFLLLTFIFWKLSLQAGSE